MAKKKADSQGEIIDEVRRARVQVGREFRLNPNRFLARAKKLAKKYGLKYATPKKKTHDEAA